MIELFTANTPNGKKISIMLEEIKIEYKVTKINIFKDEQFKPEFKKLSPFSKIPVIIDHDNNQSLFESGAILIYLGEKSGKFYKKEQRSIINQWLMGQMAYVGPMLGQHHQFHHYNSGKSEFGEKRYFKIALQIYKDLDSRLSASKFLAGKDYTIADIATFPWIARHEWHDIGLKKFVNLYRWYNEISKREAVQTGYDLLKTEETIPQA
ncbi:glutathione S-transferase [Pelagibacteraceae bacterium]|jgi:GST-like protein|nr:glutathione S-transferase [Pelagibacteraceae bacterium]MDC3233054.1 glutathione S-transferase [Pelagibacteraceae bacterium]|tara:strand:+ start:501 stop:1127 length:627 start_codon:yes stop_codon:yes gene_type:complete